METPLHLENARYGLLCQLCDHFLDDIVTGDYVPSKNNFFRFSEEWVSVSEIPPSAGRGSGTRCECIVDLISWYVDGRMSSNSFPEGSVMDVLVNILPRP